MNEMTGRMSKSFASRVEGVGLSMIRQIMLRAPADCINLGIGEPDSYAPRLVLEEALRIVEHERLLYSPNAGLPELCRRIREYHGDIPGHAVCVTNGSQEALFDVFFALINRGDEVLIPDPGFPAYRTVVEMAGGVAVPYPLPADKGFGVDLEVLTSRMGPRTRVCLSNSPSNPTGQCWSAHQIDSVARRCRDAGVQLVSDEIYEETHFRERPPTVTEFCQDAIVLSGVSKMAAMTGWRLGWACGPASVIEKATVMHQYTSSCASTLAQKAALVLFGPQGTQALAVERERLARNQEILADWIRTYFPSSLQYLPSGAFYMLLDVREWKQPSLDLAIALLDFGVATIPGSAFGAESEGFLRLSFAGQEESVAAGLERLNHGLQQLRESC